VGPLDIVTPIRTNYTFYYINIPCVCYNEVRNNSFTYDGTVPAAMIDVPCTILPNRSHKMGQA